MNLLVFFDFEPKKFFRVPTPWGLYGAEWDERFIHFSPIFAMSSVLATSGLVHNLLLQFFTLDSSKNQSFRNLFF